MSKLGLTILIVSVAVCAVLFANVPNVRDQVALFSQFIGASALILMAWAQLMATRLPVVEPLFGGLDRVYVLHKWSGILALAAILLHDTIDADMDGLGRETALVELGETLGELSLYGLLVLGVISVATFVPYHLWKWTHRVMGAFFVAGALHYLLELKPFSNFGDPVGLYVSAFCLLGLLAYVYTLLPETARRGRAYRVSSIDRTGGAAQISLASEGAPMRHAPGQFAIFSFRQTGLTEPHPYSLSAPPHADGALQITVKPLGDFTHRLLRDLKPGSAAQVQGPFGRFTRRSGGSAPELWIAGGIGITPFLAWAEALTDKDTAPVHLFWAVKSREEAPQLERIEAAAAAHPNLTLHLCVSAEGTRMTPEAVASAADMSQAKAWFCGPAPMRRSLAKALAKHGMTPRRFHYEEFEFRTGIGFKRLAASLGDRLATQKA
ncbi:putative oxidoreductase [Candidatus Rhodobacter oscarellae]|uniref:Putative oxidoreductase n=1 Tax=Candidatus Rhodobacter oscarellae TaxID=1675527 RepID=A0A0J9EBL7_9RHOB|nr:ferric reductase-like transmembrane domain-containing protein [Candidatus Rhodobacter lobularis]KMW60041.1 putative oxidoreductase [Candidatus Rhodobacter lobularis]